MSEQEEWRPVVGFPDYEVSDQGRVVSRKKWRGRTGHELGGQVKQGYRFVQLRNDAGRVTRSVHSLVAEAFISPRPLGMEVCHNDGDGLNNVPSNLRWDTRSENELDKVRQGRHYLASRTECLRGHAFAAENTVWQGPDKRHRTCRKCTNATKRRYDAKRRAARKALRSETRRAA